MRAAPPRGLERARPRRGGAAETSDLSDWRTPAPPASRKEVSERSPHPPARAGERPAGALRCQPPPAPSERTEQQTERRRSGPRRHPRRRAPRRRTGPRARRAGRRTPVVVADQRVVGIRAVRVRDALQSLAHDVRHTVSSSGHRYGEQSTSSAPGTRSVCSPSSAPCRAAARTKSLDRRSRLNSPHPRRTPSHTAGVQSPRRRARRYGRRNRGRRGSRRRLARCWPRTPRCSGCRRSEPAGHRPVDAIAAVLADACLPGPAEHLLVRIVAVREARIHDGVAEPSHTSSPEGVVFTHFRSPTGGCRPFVPEWMQVPAAPPRGCTPCKSPHTRCRSTHRRRRSHRSRCRSDSCTACPTRMPRRGHAWTHTCRAGRCTTSRSGTSR